ncbi:MAG: hypothetical protein SFV54_15220, partial [Bryobacteraceae bacterium]|nr:hypothetical protein [Bryobacteraceae bacterium]
MFVEMTAKTPIQRQTTTNRDLLDYTENTALFEYRRESAGVAIRLFRLDYIWREPGEETLVSPSFFEPP